jgi:CheY-like chemotaxis protein
MVRRILVVDDNCDAAEVMAELLKHYGYEARMACSGQQALEQASAFAPEVVLLDIGMPCMDGFETARCMRALPGGPGMRIIALTAWGHPDISRRLNEAGFERHLVKPALIDAVLAAIACGPGTKP